MIEYVTNNLKEARDGLDRLIANEATLAAITGAAQLITDAFKRGGKVISCGNGGSMCDAMHFAEELSGRFRKDRPALAAIAISDPGHLTCVANDFGYEHVFGRFVEAHGKKEDVLLGISTSGGSKNVVLAARKSREMGIKVITLTGRIDAELASLSDIHVPTPVGKFADRVQELHIKVIHIVIELVERSLFPKNY